MSDTAFPPYFQNPDQHPPKEPLLDKQGVGEEKSASPESPDSEAAWKINPILEAITSISGASDSQNGQETQAQPDNQQEYTGSHKPPASADRGQSSTPDTKLNTDDPTTQAADEKETEFLKGVEKINSIAL